MQVDVFTSQAYWGNPVAVVLDGTGLSDSAMQRFARWTQLSETTFVLPPSPKGQADGADYRLRIFTPGGELPFAGHPTLGSARAWLEGGGQVQQDGVIIQECGVGLIRIENQEGRWAFAAPPTQKRAVPTDMMAPLLSALGVEAEQVLASQILNNGPEWWCFLLDSAETVQHLNPDHLALKKMGVKVGLPRHRAALFSLPAATANRAPFQVQLANLACKAMQLFSPWIWKCALLQPPWVFWKILSRAA